MAYQIIDPPPASLEVSLVVPVKDEAENVLLLAAEIRAAMEPSPYAWECIWVDDGSSDGTGDAPAACGRGRSRGSGCSRSSGTSGSRRRWPAGSPPRAGSSS